MQSKVEFIEKFLPETVRNLDYTTINLDLSDLSLADILRNLNTIYPINSRNRNAIASGNMVICVLCKTETIEPMKGIFLVLTNEELELRLYSTDYIIFTISENCITDDDKISEIIMDATAYLANNFDGIIPNLADFYRKYVYDPYEDDDYDWDHYWSDDGYAAGVDDAMEDEDW